MLNKITVFSLVIILPLLLSAQDYKNNVSRISTIECDQEGGPNQPINEIVIYYLGTQLPDSIKNNIAGQEIELIFLIDTTGTAFLREMNGVENEFLFSAFEKRTLGLEPFIVAQQNCQKTDYIYFIKFQYPKYNTVQNPYQNPMYFGNPILGKSWNDFDSIIPTEACLDMTFGGQFSQFNGPISQDISNGGGMLMDYLLEHNSMQYGISMKINFHSIERPIPLETTEDYSTDPTFFSFGLLFGKEVIPNLFLQFKPSYIQFDFTNHEFKNPESILLSGFSPTVGAQYQIPIGRMVLSGPNLIQNCISVFAEFSPVFIQKPISNGSLVNIGLAYNMQLFGIKEYFLKSE